MKRYEILLLMVWIIVLNFFFFDRSPAEIIYDSDRTSAFDNC
jgi:hypothetical protein